VGRAEPATETTAGLGPPPFLVARGTAHKFRALDRRPSPTDMAWSSSAACRSRRTNNFVAAIDATAGQAASTRPHGVGSALARFVAKTRPAPNTRISHGPHDRRPQRPSRKISNAAIATTNSSDTAIAHATQPT
jgi:hypothetical protein